MTFKDEEMYKEFGKLLPEAIKEMGETPESLGIEMDRSQGSTWDINPPESRRKWHNIRIFSKCYKCKADIDGYLVLNKKGLNVIDSKGFMLFDEGTMCRGCIDKR